jgi:adenylylsulfate kinase
MSERDRIALDLMPYALALGLGSKKAKVRAYALADEWLAPAGQVTLEGLDQNGEPVSETITVHGATIMRRKSTRRRSIYKAITWRVVATATTAAIAWRVTGSIDAAVAIGAAECFLKLGVYYVHERLWA